MAKLDTSRTNLHHLVGARLKARRTMLGLTQDDVAQRVGITYQQLHKYETGLNRISASRLYCCARALDVPIDFFFHDSGADAQGAPQTRRRQLLSFSRAFNEIAEPHLRDAVAELARVLALPVEPAPAAAAEPRRREEPAATGASEPLSRIAAEPPYVT